jgi:2-haloacid dehalogenase
VSEDALSFAANAHAVTLVPADRDRLVEAYGQLPPWPDAAPALRRLKAAGLALAPLSNYTPAMLATLVESAGLDDVFDHQLSTDRVRTFKPHPRISPNSRRGCSAKASPYRVDSSRARNQTPRRA